ncbi:MAG: phosphoribosylanthranilate isomerase [Blautia sp.]
MKKVKICGLRRTEDVQMVNRLKPDYAGFVFAGSRRQVSISQAKKLSGLLDPDICPVGVFVNENPKTVAEIAEAGIIRLIQLHGDEGADYILELKKMTNQPVMKAVRVKNIEAILEAEQLPCEYLLLDTYVKGQYGGSGQAFDRSLIPEPKKPYLLAGGLNPDNVAQALAECGAFGADVSSAVETDGYKDEKKYRHL